MVLAPGELVLAEHHRRGLGQHERRLVLHPSYNTVLDGLCEGTIDIEDALKQLQGD